MVEALGAVERLNGFGHKLKPLRTEPRVVGEVRGL